MQLPKPIFPKLYGSMGYAGALHVRDSQLESSRSRWNLRSLVNPQHLSK